MKKLTTNLTTANEPRVEGAIVNWMKKDIVLNVGFRESMERALMAIFVPWPLICINRDLIFAAIPIVFYLFISGLVHFCPIRWVWFHIVAHISDPKICDFALELRIPVKAI